MVGVSLDELEWVQFVQMVGFVQPCGLPVQAGCDSVISHLGIIMVGLFICVGALFCQCSANPNNFLFH